MALTRPRYSQIPDSDYKNSCRIVTTTNVTLSGSAPLTYDGVTLIQYDRVLVAGQTDKTQNGIYSVSILGSGSNGTWVRSKDANANDRLTAGMNTFVEEGTYTGQFWHLLTPGPIVLGVTELIFGQITGNAAGTSSQVQYNSSGSIAGAANLRYDAATGNVLIGGGTASNSNVTGALVVNGGIGVTGEIWASSNIYSAGSRVLTTYDLETVTFLANYISKDPANVYVPVVGTGTIYGTHNFGNLEAISTFGDYNTTAQSGYYSVNDASGAPGFVVYIGFTGITDFNRAVYNINYTQNSGHTITIDLYNYDTDAWDAFAQYSGSGSWQTFALSVIDSDPYIDATGNVTTRIYHVSSGNTSHRTWIDYVALEKSITGGSGPRGPVGATGPSGTYSGGYISGAIITAGNIVSNSGNISISTTTGAIVITGDGGIGVGGNIFAGGNITANAFYTINGLFWEGNGLAFSSGLEVSEINAANTVSNISSQVTSIRFDRDTGFSVTELDPGNVKISLGSSFKTWHVPGQADLVAAAEDEVTFFGNGIDITTNPTFPKSITFIANNSIIEANIGAFYNYANANIGAFYNYANANIGTLYLGNISTQANLGAFQLYANSAIDGTITEITALSESTTANAATQSLAIGALSANINAFQSYANTKIGTNNNSNLVVTSTTDSVSSLTGAVVVAGGVGIGGNLYVAGNIYASNLTAISISTLSVTDPLLYLTANTPFPYNYDIGFFSHYSTTSGFDQHTGIARNYTNGIWGFFSNLYANPGGTVDWTEANIIYDTVRVGDLVASNTTPSTSTTTGALRVAGGVGIQGNLYITNTGDVSANIGTLFLGNAATQANLGSLTSTVDELAGFFGSYKSYANVYLGVSKTFAVTNVTSDEYVIDGIAGNPGLYLIRGQKYNFSVDTSSHVFWIKTAPTTGTGDQYSTGVIGNGTDNGLIVFDVPLSAPDVLYYASQYDATMNGQLNIVDFGDINSNISTLFLGNASTNSNLGTFQTYANTRIATLDANVGTLFLGNASTNANLGAFQTYSNSSFATLDANVGTLFLGNASTNANLGTFQTYANATFTTYSNTNVAAYLPTHTGNISAGNISVTSKIAAGTVYTTSGIYWSGNGNPYATGGGSGITYTASTTPPVSPAIADQWYDTAEGILYEYMDDGDTNQWVDIVSPTFSGASPVAFNSNVTVTGNILIGDGIYWSANGDPYSSGGGGGGSGEDAVLRANVGAYQIYANANIGTLFLGNISVNANLGAYQTWANSRIQTLDANIGTLFLGNASTNANLGAFQTFSNANAAAQAVAINTINANLGAYQIYANANIGTLFVGNSITNANLGAYQIWANSNFGTSTYSNTNVAAYLSSGIQSTGANIAGDVNIVGNLTASLGFVLEKTNIVPYSPPSVSNIDILECPIVFFTSNATSNVTVNLRGNSTTALNDLVANGQAVTFSVFFPQSATPYYVNQITIDGTTVPTANVSWQGYVPVTSGNANSIDLYAFTAIKGSINNWRVFATQTTYTHTGQWINYRSVQFSAEYLVIAGGGSGATSYGGGGGAGGLRYGTMSITGESTYTVVVGGGGAAVSVNSVNGNPGTNSNIAGTGITTITATGGGYGGRQGAAGGNGGSGGGGGSNGPFAGGSSSPVTSPVQGYAGGSGFTNTGVRGGGGGGGSGGTGSNGSSVAGGAGGTGTNAYSTWATATSSGVGGFYAGGGGGGAISGTNVGGAGGSGGGGAGGSNNNISGTAGSANTGGGGGGMGDRPSSGSSGAGGSGVVIIRYLSTYSAASSTTGSPTLYTSGGYRYYKFTGDGSITW